MKRNVVILILMAIMATACATTPQGWATAHQTRIEAIEAQAVLLLADKHPADIDTAILAGATTVMAQTYWILSPTVADTGTRAQLSIAAGEAWCKKWIPALMKGRTLADVAFSRLGLNKETTSAAEALLGILEGALATSK